MIAREIVESHLKKIQDTLEYMTGRCDKYKRATRGRSGADLATDALDALAKVTEALTEHEALFNRRSRADDRAIKLWQERTGEDLTFPDHADLVVFLLEKHERLRTDVKMYESIQSDTVAMVHSREAVARAAAIRQCAEVRTCEGTNPCAQYPEANSYRDGWEYGQDSMSDAILALLDPPALCEEGKTDAR